MVIDIINKRTDFVTQVLETGLRVGEFEKYYTAQELRISLWVLSEP